MLFLGDWVLEAPEQFMNGSLLDVSYFIPWGNLGDPGELVQEGKQKAECHRVASAAKSDRLK